MIFEAIKVIPVVLSAQIVYVSGKRVFLVLNYRRPNETEIDGQFQTKPDTELVIRLELAPLWVSYHTKVGFDMGMLVFYYSGFFCGFMCQHSEILGLNE